MPGSALLDIRSVSYSFGALRAVNDVSLAVHEGEILGLVGPNGAGKTTLFNMLTGVLTPQSGDVVFGGTSIKGRSVHGIARMGIARTFQIERIFRTMTVLDNVLVGAYLRERGEAAAKRRAMEQLALVGLAELAPVQAGMLTLMNRKRLEVARALATKPRLLLIDELMGGLTPSEIEFASHLLDELRAGGLTLVVIEHVLEAVLKLSDRLVVLNFGIKIAEGDPRVVMNDPEVGRAYLGKAATRA